MKTKKAERGCEMMQMKCIKQQCQTHSQCGIQYVRWHCSLGCTNTRQYVPYPITFDPPQVQVLWLVWALCTVGKRVLDPGTVWMSCALVCKLSSTAIPTSRVTTLIYSEYDVTIEINSSTMKTGPKVVTKQNYTFMPSVQIHLHFYSLSVQPA